MEALHRLKVTPEQIEACPKIEPVLKVSRGWKKQALNAMRFSDGELTRLFLDKWDTIPERDRDNVTFEAVALAVDINPRHLLGEILLAMRETSASQVKMIAMSAHPKVMKARVEYALTPGGFRDRDKVDEILGAIKAPMGSTFIGKAFFGGDKEEAPEPEELEDDVNVVFPECEAMQEKIQPMRQKLLEGK